VSSAVVAHRRQNAGSIQAEYGTNRLDWANTELLFKVVYRFGVAKCITFSCVLCLNWENILEQQKQIPLISEPFPKNAPKIVALTFCNLQWADVCRLNFRTTEVRTDVEWLQIV
jgi:hypothetical protein